MEMEKRSPRPFLKTRQVAEHLQISESMVRREAARGRLPGFKLFGSGPRSTWRFDPDEIDDLGRRKEVR